jgi:hypothetical protein
MSFQTRLMTMKRLTGQTYLKYPADQNRILLQTPSQVPANSDMA